MVDSRRDECVLIIESLTSKESGPWECVAIDGREEASKYVIINVTEKKERFQLLINPDETDVDVRRGDDVQILCPTNHDSSTPQDRPICRFISPSGKRYDLIGK